MKTRYAGSVEPNAERKSGVCRYFYSPADIAVQFGPDQALVLLPGEETGVTVPASLVAFAGQCRGLRSLDEHAAVGVEQAQRARAGEDRSVLARLVGSVSERVFGKDALTTEARIVVRSRLEQCVNLGLLRREDELIPPPTATAGIAAPPVDVLAIPTTGQLPLLQRAVRSYLAVARRDAARYSILAVDDSDDPRTCEGAYSFLGSLADSATLRYAGPHQKRRFADRLAATSGVPISIINFALFGDPEVQGGAGRNRNAILLETIGHLLVMVDDDSLPLVAVEPSDGIGLAAHDTSSDLWFFGDRREALARCGKVTASVPAIHEGLLGAGLAECLLRLRSGDATPVWSEDLGERLISALRYRSGRVLVSRMGVVGDSGGVVPYLILRGDSFGRLVRSEPAYRAACRSREILQLPTRSTISAGRHCNANGLGLDNRVMLPPFFPVLRDEDGLFGHLLTRSHPHGFATHLRTALLHSPAETRLVPSGQAWSSGPVVRLSDVVSACIGGAPQIADEEPARRLRVLGEHLVWLTSAGRPEDFRMRVQQGLVRDKSAYVNLLCRRLSEEPAAPDYWANDVKKAISRVEKAISEPNWDVPVDVLPDRSVVARWGVVRRCVNLYGRLLASWPSIVEASRQLAAQGHGLAVRVGR